jgi:hypothetical protein
MRAAARARACWQHSTLARPGCTASTSTCCVSRSHKVGVCMCMCALFCMYVYTYAMRPIRIHVYRNIRMYVCMLHRYTYIRTYVCMLHRALRRMWPTTVSLLLVCLSSSVILRSLSKIGLQRQRARSETVTPLPSVLPRCGFLQPLPIGRGGMGL